MQCSAVYYYVWIHIEIIEIHRNLHGSGLLYFHFVVIMKSMFEKIRFTNFIGCDSRVD